MAIFKCKMCGGTLEINGNASVAECEFCGTTQTLPKLTDDKRGNLYDRANHLRRNNEYDKALAIYEQILNEDNTDAEAHWSIVLCRYGIVYVEDPVSHKQIPTVNRAQYTSIYADEDYRAAIQYADGYQKDVYEAEAKAIDTIQKGILSISQSEEPFDVFICYKETDVSGRRTKDSVLAQELYYGLTNEGFKVFFSRITLEDKLGTAYEPYIFAALNSSKVMVVLGTCADHFNAVWVKNEWSRYLALIRKGEKKTLIPAYKDMDPYDLPEEFSHLQAQDMTKLGFMQDLIRGIKKIAGPAPAVAPVSNFSAAPTQSYSAAPTGDSNIANLLRRAEMFLADGDFASAHTYCEKVLDLSPENGDAYMFNLMASVKVKDKSQLASCGVDYSDYPDYRKAMMFCTPSQQDFLRRSLEQSVRTRRELGEISKLSGDVALLQQTVNQKSAAVNRLTTEINNLNAREAAVGKKSLLSKVGALLHLFGLFFLFVGFISMIGSDGASGVLMWLMSYPMIIGGTLMMMIFCAHGRYSVGSMIGHIFRLILLDINGLILCFRALKHSKRGLTRDIKIKRKAFETQLAAERTALASAQAQLTTAQQALNSHSLV